jgi:hypothetical protein
LALKERRGGGTLAGRKTCVFKEKKFIRLIAVKIFETGHDMNDFVLEIK